MQTISHHILAGLVRHRQVADRQGDARLVAVGRAAQVVILAHHVAHDPVKVDVRTRRIGRHGPVAQHDRMVGDRQRFFQVMRDIDDADPPRRQVADHLEQHLDLAGRQRAGRFVHDQDAAVHRQGAGDFHDLLLAQAQFLDRGQGIDILLQFLHQDADLAFLLSEIDAHGAAQFAPHEDVVADRQVGGQRQFLVDDGNAPVAGLVRVGKADRPAVQDDLPGGGLDHARQDLHQRRFARAVLAEQGGDLAAMDVEVHALQRVDIAV